MFGALFGRRKDTGRRPASLPDGCVVWAIGDIHGRLDLLDVLLGAIEKDLASCGAVERLVIGLGDYIDRGPQSRGVLDRLVHLARHEQIRLVLLKGNHEDRFEAFMADPAIGPAWCEFGGRETLWSYDIAPPPPRADMDAWTEVSQRLRDAVPAEHHALLASQRLSLEIGDYFFVHAGVRPDTPLEHQSPQDLLWIRQAFLDNIRPLEKVIVHGHTPADDVHADGVRIGLDTGAYATGRLSAIRLEGAERRLLQTQTGPDGVTAIEQVL